MARILRIGAAIAISIGGAAAFFLSSRNDLHLRVAASGADTAEFRARLIAYMGDLESTLPLLEAVAREAGVGAEASAPLRSLSIQCAAACEMLAAEPSPEEARMWNEMERIMSFNRDWWAIPSTLRGALERQSDGGSESASSLGTSPYDDCPEGKNPTVIIVLKLVTVTADGLSEIVPETITIAGFSAPFPLKSFLIVVKTIAEFAFELLDHQDGFREGCLQEKVITVLDRTDALDAKLDDILDDIGSMERLQVEEDLARTGSGRIAVLELPDSVEVDGVQGKFFEVKQLVFDTINEFRKSGQLQDRSDARESFLRGEFWEEEGDFVQAYTHYRAAYQAAVSR